MKDRPRREGLRRSYSNHVVSRNYRSPELILLEKNYDTKIDMWSLGCIIADILIYIKYERHQGSSTTLFPGTSCFPLSPVQGEEYEKVKQWSGEGEGKASMQVEVTDQMMQILGVLGKPNEHDTSFLTDKDSLMFLKMIEQPDHQKNKLKELFPDTNPQLLKLLKGLLEFNPVFRLSAKQALKNPIFDSIRVPFYEQGCPKKIFQTFNEPGSFCYEGDKPHKMKNQDFKKMLVAEITKV